MSRFGGSYPHPVLGHGDDVSSTFEITAVKQTSSTDSIYCQFRLALDDPEVLELLNSSRVQLAVTWACNATLQRGWTTPDLITDLTSSQLYRFHIDQNNVFGRINCGVQLIAMEAIPDYCLTNQNHGYGTFTFDLEPGDIVGVAGSFSLEAHKLYDPMQPPVDSCFRIVQSDAVTAPVDFRLDYSLQDYVRIELSKDAFERFLGLRSHPDLQVAFVAFPALIATLSEMKVGSDTEIAETGWFKSLSQLLVRNGKQETDVVEQAQWLLETPVLKGMRDHAEGEGEELD